MITDIESATPALCRLQLGSELGRLRGVAGLTGSQVSRKLIWSPSKLTRLETGENATVEQSDVRALCEMYEANEETMNLLLGYAAVTKTKRDWWQSSKFRPVITPVFRAFLGLEATAASLCAYEQEFVPGLLQTEGYMRVIHQSAYIGKTPDEVTRIIAVRLARQEVLRRKQAALKYTAILNEAVLRRRVGDGELMKEQLSHIVEVAEELPNVRIQVVPFEAGDHPGMNGKFAVLRFPEGAALRSIVYLEHLTDAFVGRRQEDVTRYEEAFSDLQALSPSHRDSLAMIRKAIKEF
ncbi:helix-turn-helix transcriptional regulator [Streptomyces sp. DSM 44915]|uniref:Helix-turn-helix transcriptional regulator n=1 Tax=Streptomyces chisholmiae TaxID=3075540 RepID=A0ABU2JLD3_9ACTN|nr:helix-turn-helix transcriptional regulator [Streptomyces sp. DSM 44915]MDT0265797.1 helix-turn-helix transcriptional regulator [Streptomyces sp. DSM 44915]